MVCCNAEECVFELSVLIVVADSVGLGLKKPVSILNEPNCRKTPRRFMGSVNNENREG